MRLRNGEPAMRILIYSHDSYGLGHIRRSLSIAKQVASDYPTAEQLLLTGSAQAHSFEKPERLDYVKFPTISKIPDGKYCPGSLPVSFESLMAIREDIILNTVKHFKADLLMVDKAPAGIRGEMLRSLKFLKSEHPKTKLVLGMRDIEDDALLVREEWKRGGVYPLLEEVYDAIFLYGSRDIYDPVYEYGLSHETCEKVISCGYIGRDTSARPVDQVRKELNMKTNTLIVVTVGGGGDGFNILSAYLEMLFLHQSELSFDSLVVTGPLMDEEHRLYLQRYDMKGLPLALIDFTPDMMSYLNAADLIISMGGYNTFCEILSLNKQAIIIPRVKPRLEQLIRAKRFSDLGLVGMIHPDELSPERLWQEVNCSIKRSRPVRPKDVGVDLNGAVNVSRAIGRLVSKKGMPN